MTEYRHTKVFDINGHLVIAPSIEDAIKVFKEYDAKAEISNISAISVYHPTLGNNYNAIMSEKEDYNPYKVTVESIIKMLEVIIDKDDLIANIKAKCKDAINYEKKYGNENS